MTRAEATALLARYTPQEQLSKALTALLKDAQDAQARSRDALHLLASSVQRETRSPDMPDDITKRLSDAVDRALKAEQGE